MSADLLCVSLACNNESGNFAGTIEAVQIDDLISLEGEPLTCTAPNRTDMQIEGLTIRTSGYIPWYGNIMWDAVRLDLFEAARLLEHLRRKHWTCTEGEIGLVYAYEGTGDLGAALRKAHASS